MQFLKIEYSSYLHDALQNLISSHKDPGLSLPTASVKVFLNQLAVKLEGEDLMRDAAFPFRFRFVQQQEQKSSILTTLIYFRSFAWPEDWNAAS